MGIRIEDAESWNEKRIKKREKRVLCINLLLQGLYKGKRKIMVLYFERL